MGHCFAISIQEGAIPSALNEKLYLPIQYAQPESLQKTWEPELFQ